MEQGDFVREGLLGGVGLMLLVDRLRLTAKAGSRLASNQLRCGPRRRPRDARMSEPREIIWCPPRHFRQIQHQCGWPIATLLGKSALYHFV